MDALDVTVVQPDPKIWPICGECKTPYVLRRCMQFGFVTRDDGLKAGELHAIWAWQIDCKHKKVDAELTGMV